MTNTTVPPAFHQDDLRDLRDTQSWAADYSADATDRLASRPREVPAMFHGLLGDTARAASDGREISIVSAGLAALTWLSAQVGRNLVVGVGDSKHRLNLYGLHIGRSAVAGKGESLSLLKRINSKLAERGVSVSKDHRGGVSTAEGIAALIHDGYREGKNVFEPVDDKRLYVVEEEMGAMLARMKREGNTLSSGIRGAWDGLDIKPAVKSCKVWATDPHLALHGCITPTELRSMLTNGDMTNGFANRFLMVFAERTGIVPYPDPTRAAVIDDLVERYQQVIDWALDGYPEVQDARTMVLSPKSRTFWDEVYRGWKADIQNDPLAHLTERRYPIALRIAALFAACDNCLEIDLPHLYAGIAWANYGIESVKFVFSDLAGGDDDHETREHAEKIVLFLQAAGGWCSRTTLIVELFKKRLPAADLTKALDWLLKVNPQFHRREMKSGSPKKRTEYCIKERADAHWHGPDRVQAAPYGQVRALDRRRQGRELQEQREEARVDVKPLPELPADNAEQRTQCSENYAPEFAPVDMDSPCYSHNSGNSDDDQMEGCT